MASQFTQIVGENIPYAQEIIGDTIVSAAWNVDPAGPSIDPDPPTATKAKAFLEIDEEGVFVLTVTLNCASGQIRKGQGRIHAVARVV